MVKHDLWTTEKILSTTPVARLLYFAMWNFCDDAGIHPAAYMQLKAEVFPADNFTIDDIRRLIKELIDNRLLSEYAVEGELYWIVNNWRYYQKIDKPTFRYPLPESELMQIADNSMLANRALDDNSTISRRYLEESSASNQRACSHGSTSAQPMVNETSGMKRREEKVKEDICSVKTARGVVSKPSADVLMIFAYWQTVMKHPKAKLDTKRTSTISQALQAGYSVDDLKQAIDGCASTPFNIGKNEKGQIYDGIDLIFRDADHIEKFIQNSINPPTSANAEGDSRPAWMKEVI
jgi:hypothetical protein